MLVCLVLFCCCDPVCVLFVLCVCLVCVLFVCVVGLLAGLCVELSACSPVCVCDRLFVWLFV